MKKLIILSGAAFILSMSFLTTATAQSNRQINKENRKITKQERKLYKQEARQSAKASSSERESYRQRRKIVHDASKANKRRKYDTNEQGNVLERL